MFRPPRITCRDNLHAQAAALRLEQRNRHDRRIDVRRGSRCLATDKKTTRRADRRDWPYRLRTKCATGIREIFRARGRERAVKWDGVRRTLGEKRDETMRC